jgi:hypothetical protein
MPCKARIEEPDAKVPVVKDHSLGTDDRRARNPDAPCRRLLARQVRPGPVRHIGPWRHLSSWYQPYGLVLNFPIACTPASGDNESVQACPVVLSILKAVREIE